MTELKLLSAALIAAATLTPPAMARENHVTSQHRAEDANASTTPRPRYICEGDGFRGNHFGGGFPGTPGFAGTPGDGYGGFRQPSHGLPSRSARWCRGSAGAHPS